MMNKNQQYQQLQTPLRVPLTPLPVRLHPVLEMVSLRRQKNQFLAINFQSNKNQGIIYFKQLTMPLFKQTMPLLLNAKLS